MTPPSLCPPWRWRKVEESNPYAWTSPVFETGVAPLPLHLPRRRRGSAETQFPAPQKGTPEPGCSPGGIRRGGSRRYRSPCLKARARFQRGPSPTRISFQSVGRDGGVRTHDLLYPKQARFQTAPHPVSERESRGETATSLHRLVCRVALASRLGRESVHDGSVSLPGRRVQPRGSADSSSSAPCQ